MIVIISRTDGSYFVTGVYYLKGAKPTLLAEGFVAGHGERAMRRPSIREEKS